MVPLRERLIFGSPNAAVTVSLMAALFLHDVGMFMSFSAAKRRHVAMVADALGMPVSRSRLGAHVGGAGSGLNAADDDDDDDGDEDDDDDDDEKEEEEEDETGSRPRIWLLSMLPVSASRARLCVGVRVGGAAATRGAIGATSTWDASTASPAISSSPSMKFSSNSRLSI
jgi:hypothetical protein